MDQKDTSFDAGAKHAFGLLSLFLAVNLYSRSPLNFRHALGATFFFVLAYALLVRDLPRMSLPDFGMMFYAMGFFGILHGIEGIRYGHTLNSTRYMSNWEIYGALDGGVLCAIAGAFCFWMSAKQKK